MLCNCYVCMVGNFDPVMGNGAQILLVMLVVGGLL